MDEVRIPWVFDSRGVTKGAEEIEKAFDKVEKKGKSAMGDGASAGITDAALTKGLVRAERSLKSHHSEMEREHKAHNQRIYQEATKAAEYRHAALVKSLRRENDATKSAGGAGGHGGGAGGSTRGVGDAINILTGSSGNVMRLNALGHIGGVSAVGGGAALVGIGLIAKFLSDAHEQMKETERIAAQLQSDFGAGGKTRGVINASSGAGSLSEYRSKVKEQIKAEDDLQTRLAEAETHRKASPLNYQILREAAIKQPLLPAGWGRAMMGGAQTLSEQQQQSDSRKGALQSEFRRVELQTTAATSHATGVARERATGSTFEAQRQELGIAEKLELTNAKISEFTATQRDDIRERFDIEKEELDRRERAQQIEREGAQEIADLRGNAEDRARATSEIEVATAKKLLENARGVEAMADATTRAKQRGQAADLLTIEQNSAAAGRSASLLSSGFGVANAASRSSLSYYGANQEKQFQSGQMQAAAGAQQNVGNATLALDAAREQTRLHLDDATYLEKEREAENDLTKANVEQLDVSHRLTAESALRNRLLRTELTAAQNVTAALRIANTGRGDRAALHESRSAANAQALQFEREGRPDMAREVMEQQRQREVGLFDDKFLNPNGTRRSRFAINKEERMARLTEQRRGRANSRLAENLGLIDVRRDMSGRVLSGTDPLTREKMTAEEAYARTQRPHQTAAQEVAEDAKLTPIRLGTIIQILQDRLPAD